MSESNQATMLVGRWTLKDAPKTYKQAEIMLSTAGETALPTDNRALVDGSDFKDGGKYRSIVKLFIQFEKQTDTSAWAMATGYLVQPDLVVTAGHCAFDWSSSMGRAIRIKAYIGYNGKASIDDSKSDVQFCKGLQIVTTSGWISGEGNRESDVSFIQLGSKFTGALGLITYTGTPVQGSESLGIVGYPADKKNGSGEQGAQMWEEFESVKYDLRTTYKNMLEYKISTYAGGNSGSPVLRSKRDNGSFVSIATHAYGGLRANSGSPIAGNYGNYYDSCLSAFDSKAIVVKTVNQIEFVSVACKALTEFSFSDALGIVSAFGGISSTALSTASPFLGPIAGPIAAVAGAALGFAGNLAKNNMTSEASISGVTDYTGFVQRGIIGEAALQTILDMKIGTYQKLKLNDKLTDAFNVLGPNLYGLGPRILPLVLRPAASIGYDAYEKVEAAYQNLKNGGTETSQDTTPKSLTHPAVAEGATDTTTSDFLYKMWADTVEVSGEDWFFQQLGDVIYNAIINSRTPTKTAPDGMCFLSSLSSAKGNNFELNDVDTDFQSLSLRAVFGEAAIQALIKCDHVALQSEKCFDTIKKNAQGIGRQTLKTADWLLPLLQPIIAQLLKGDKNPPTNKKEVNIKTPKSNDSNKASMLQKAALLTAGMHNKSTRNGTVQQMLADKLQNSVNLDGLAFTRI